MEISSSAQLKIEKIIEFTTNNLCVISDFDKTISKGIDKNGNILPCSFSVYGHHTELLGENHKNDSSSLFKKYYPIEQSGEYTDEQKQIHMIQWWKEEFELYKKYNFKNSTIDTIIEKNLIDLKDHTTDFLKLTNDLKLPTILYSAGVYNLIDGFIKKTNNNYKNINIIANQFKFDTSGNFIGTNGDVIHSQNKTFTQISNLPVYNTLKDKKTCILIGDSPSDIKMVEGSNFDTILKIGFLNTIPKNIKYQDRLNIHRDRFDIILPGYENFKDIVKLLENVSK